MIADYTQANYKREKGQLMFAKFQNKLEIHISDNHEIDVLVNSCSSYDKDTRPDTAYIIYTLSEYMLRSNNIA